MILYALHLKYQSLQQRPFEFWPRSILELIDTPSDLRTISLNFSIKFEYWLDNQIIWWSWYCSVYFGPPTVFWNILQSKPRPIYGSDRIRLRLEFWTLFDIITWIISLRISIIKWQYLYFEWNVHLIWRNWYSSW